MQILLETGRIGDKDCDCRGAIPNLRAPWANITNCAACGVGASPAQLVLPGFDEEITEQQAAEILELDVATLRWWRRKHMQTAYSVEADHL